MTKMLTISKSNRCWQGYIWDTLTKARQLGALSIKKVVPIFAFVFGQSSLVIVLEVSYGIIPGNTVWLKFILHPLRVGQLLKLLGRNSNLWRGKWAGNRSPLTRNTLDRTLVRIRINRNKTWQRKESPITKWHA